MKYKVGDAVKIKSENWYKINRNESGDVKVPGNSFVSYMSMYCGQLTKITRIYKEQYRIDIDGGYWSWTDEMFENMEETKIKLPEGWEVDRVENGEIILKESKKGLPKTWEDCIASLVDGEYITLDSTLMRANLNNISIDKVNKNFLPKGLGRPMLALMQLLICREVYRQGWKPNWNDREDKFCIIYRDNEILPTCYFNHSEVLSFQSEEVRDKFLENFRDLIEEAKELL